MAIAVGSIVSLSLASGDLPVNAQGPDVNPQPPKFGVVVADAGGGAWDIEWEQGNFTPAIPAAGVDDLAAVAAASRTELLGRVCQVASESPEYRGVCVALYKRSDGADRALLQMLSTEAMREVFVAQLDAVAGV